MFMWANVLFYAPIQNDSTFANIREGDQVVVNSVLCK